MFNGTGSLNCHQYSGGPSADSLLEARRRRMLAGNKLIPCPGGCGGKALLQPLMKVIRDGVMSQIYPVRCIGSCRTEKQLPSGAIAKEPKVYQLTELPGKEASKLVEPEPPKQTIPAKTIRAKQQARVAKQNLEEKKRAENWARFCRQVSQREIVTLPIYNESDILGGALDRA